METVPIASRRNWRVTGRSGPTIPETNSTSEQKSDSITKSLLHKDVSTAKPKPVRPEPPKFRSSEQPKKQGYRPVAPPPPASTCSKKLGHHRPLRTSPSAPLISSIKVSSSPSPVTKKQVNKQKPARVVSSPSLDRQEKSQNAQMFRKSKSHNTSSPIMKKLRPTSSLSTVSHVKQEQEPGKHLNVPPAPKSSVRPERPVLPNVQKRPSKSISLTSIAALNNSRLKDTSTRHQNNRKQSPQRPAPPKPIGNGLSKSTADVSLYDYVDPSKLRYAPRADMEFRRKLDGSDQTLDIPSTGHLTSSCPNVYAAIDPDSVTENVYTLPSRRMQIPAPLGSGISYSSEEIDSITRTGEAKLEGITDNDENVSDSSGYVAVLPPKKSARTFNEVVLVNHERDDSCGIENLNSTNRTLPKSKSFTGSSHSLTSSNVVEKSSSHIYTQLSRETVDYLPVYDICKQE